MAAKHKPPVNTPSTVSSGGGSSRRSPVPAAEGPFAATLELPSKPLTPQEKAARKKREMREKVRINHYTSFVKFEEVAGGTGHFLCSNTHPNNFNCRFS